MSMDQTSDALQKSAEESKVIDLEMATDEEASDLASMKQQLADETRLRQYTEKVLDARQQELENQEAENLSLRAEIDAIRHELSSAQDQLSQAHEKTKAKEKLLSNAKDQIFRFQSTRKDITESEAVAKYRTLCGNVQRWVENRMRPILDDLDNGRLRPWPPSIPATRFVSFMREAARRGIDLDQSDTYHVISIIMNYLSLVFFSKSFYSPLDDYEGDATSQLIDDLETSMSRLHRDAGHCREWRSETLTALTSQSSFKSRRARFLTLVCEDLASLLSIVVPRSSIPDLEGSLRRSIVEPAADLVHQLHLSPSVFTLKWPARGPWSRLEVYECLNLATGGIALDLSGTKPSSPARRNVCYLFDVAPGLFVERLEGGKKLPPKAVCKPTVLVFGGDGEVPQNATILRWLWNSSRGGPGSGRQSPARASTLRSESPILLQLEKQHLMPPNRVFWESYQPKAVTEALKRIWDIVSCYHQKEHDKGTEES